jgi:hypothetical protein
MFHFKCTSNGQHLSVEVEDNHGEISVNIARIWDENQRRDLSHTQLEF